LLALACSFGLGTCGCVALALQSLRRTECWRLFGTASSTRGA
jgi:hypothetical protein